MVNWNAYLESLCKDYAHWWDVYTLTDVVGRKREEQEQTPPLFDFGLMVETVERDREERGERQEKTERLTVLEGLRKYASDHVLLVGKPGSGKSTALVRLLLEEAEKLRYPLSPPLARREAQSNSQSDSPLFKGGRGGSKIPVLVELRYYRTSVLDLIQAFLQRHDPDLAVDGETLKTWLLQGQLLLLIDGVNELPSEAARRDLQGLRRDYEKTAPMVFTTRDLGVGGDLNIAKKLEMQPLNEGQMQQFVRAYLPETGEEMLNQLGGRLKEFGETPLLLKMLCDLFLYCHDIPTNLGSVFRAFTKQYDNKIQAGVPAESREFWSDLLQHLALAMTAGDKPTEIQVAISKQEAEKIVREFLRKEGFGDSLKLARNWLNDLLKYHLIQLKAGDQIEFRHQLIQEYYTAERLLQRLPSLSDEELQWEYLNYLKWTETLALGLGLAENETQAVRVVKLALEVDWQLGARLAGEVRSNWQGQTVDLVLGLEIPLLFKIHLLDRTKSDAAIPRLIKALEDQDSFVRESATVALGKIGSDAAIFGLIKALKDQNYDVRRNASILLVNIGSDETITGLIKTLEDQDYNVRHNVVVALGNIGSDGAISRLIKALSNEKFVIANNGYTLRYALEALEKVQESCKYYNIKPVPPSVTMLKLLKISHPEIITLLDKLTSGDASDRLQAEKILDKIGTETAITELSKILLEAEIAKDRFAAAKALGEIGNENAIPALSKAVLEDKDAEVRGSAIRALGKIGRGQKSAIESNGN